MKNKSILLFEYSWRNIDFITDNISGTMIRQDYRKYRNLIDEDFYEYLEGNVK